MKNEVLNFRIQDFVLHEKNHKIIKFNAFSHMAPSVYNNLKITWKEIALHGAEIRL